MCTIDNVISQLEDWEYRLKGAAEELRGCIDGLESEELDEVEAISDYIGEYFSSVYSKIEPLIDKNQTIVGLELSLETQSIDIEYDED